MKIRELIAQKLYVVDFYDAGGVRHRRQFKGNATDAKLWAKQWEQKLNESIYFPERREIQITYGELADAYLKLRWPNGAPRSARYMWAFCKKKFGASPMRELTSLRLQQFYNDLTCQHTIGTCNRYFSVISAVIESGIRFNLWNGKNPCVAVRKQREKNVQEVIWEPEDLKALFHGCREDVKEIVLCALYSGMRRREIFDMRWENVNMERGFIDILDSKTDDRRIVPMCNHLKALLIKIGPKKSGKVFKITLSAFENAFKRLRKKKGLMLLNLHTCRHTFSSMFRANKGDLYDLQAILGHHSLRMTRRYTHLSPEYLEKAIACLNDPNIHP